MFRFTLNLLLLTENEYTSIGLYFFRFINITTKVNKKFIIQLDFLIFNWNSTIIGFLWFSLCDTRIRKTIFRILLTSLALNTVSAFQNKNIKHHFESNLKKPNTK